jgi:hypothetical protein
MEGADHPKSARSTKSPRAIPELAINPHCHRESIGSMWGLDISILTSAPEYSPRCLISCALRYRFDFSVLILHPFSEQYISPPANYQETHGANDILADKKQYSATEEFLSHLQISHQNLNLRGTSI